jgi:hypothetical protein
MMGELIQTESRQTNTLAMVAQKLRYAWQFEDRPKPSAQRRFTMKAKLDISNEREQDQ